MANSGAFLVLSSESGPRQDRLDIGWRLPDQLPEQPPHFGHRHWEELGCSLLWKRPFFRAVVLTTVKNASANIARVRCRYQPCQWRTSYSSNPTCPLASSIPSSTCHRLPAARTTTSKVTDSGAETK